MAQLLDLPSKQEAPNSNPSTTKKKKKSASMLMPGVQPKYWKTNKQKQKENNNDLNVRP
jgi:hypothetical protein